MKKILFVCSALIFFVSISCKEKSDPVKDKEAILKVLQEEGDAFSANDLNRVFATHIQDSTATRLELAPDSYKIYGGWNEIENLYKEYSKVNLADSNWRNPKNLKGNIIIKVVGNSAWVLCDNTWKFEFNKVEQEYTNMQIAFLEKINGEWKISFDGFVPKPVAIVDTVASK